MSYTCRIQAILLAMGYRPYTLAFDLDVSWRVAKRLLYGKNSLVFADIERICDKLGVRAGFLLNDPDYRAELRRDKKKQEAKAEKLEAEGKEAARLARSRPPLFKPYDFIHTLGGHNLFCRMRNGDIERSQYEEAKECYNQYLDDWAGDTTKADIEAESVRLYDEYSKICVLR